MVPQIAGNRSHRYARCTLYSLVVLLMMISLLPQLSSAASREQRSVASRADTSMPELRALLCADVLIIGARGSGEKTAGNRGLGARVGEFTRQLQSSIEPNHTVEVHALTLDQYKAYSVWRLLDKRKGLRGSAFFDGVASGIRHTIRVMENRKEKCPDQVFVLAGYSQGAMVMHRVMNSLQKDGRNALLRRIRGVALIADGDRVRNTETHLVGHPVAGARGIGVGVALWNRRDITGTMAARTWSICTRNDLVCDFRLNWLDTWPLLRPHLLSVVINGLRVHLGNSYTETNETFRKPVAAISSAVIDVDDARALGMCAPAPEKCKITGNQAVPFKLNHRVSTLITTATVDADGFPVGRIGVINTSGELVWVRSVGIYGNALAPSEPFTDESGNIFVEFNPGRYNEVIVLRPRRRDRFSFRDFGSLPEAGGYNGRWYYANLRGPGADGLYRIAQHHNDCRPDCAGGNITTDVYRWNGTNYVKQN